MASKLWSKDVQISDQIEQFTTGNDRELDLFLAPFDVLGSLAHINMLTTIGLIKPAEHMELHKALLQIYDHIQAGTFRIDEGVEDIHSQIEFTLTQQLGEVGKKIHSGRSRNDQVLVDLKLFMRDAIEAVVSDLQQLFTLLQTLSEKHKEVIMPGYTHFQVAMPSSFGLWFGAYAEALIDDMHTLLAAYRVVNKNPLGSAAGYGSSFPLNRTLTTQLLGFESLNTNVVYAQMTRGKADTIVLQSFSNVAYTLNKLATDCVLYVSQNFNFIQFPEEVMEGSSIMPHKKNPDVFELIRAKTNQIKAHTQAVLLLTTNMPSGYHRDWQILKEYLIPSVRLLRSCITLTQTMLSKIQVQTNLANQPIYTYMYSVDRVNELVLAGVPFRDAYQQVGAEIKNGTFKPVMNRTHTHEGSIGNLQTVQIHEQFNSVVQQFHFDVKNKAIHGLLSPFS